MEVRLKVKVLFAEIHFYPFQLAALEKHIPRFSN